MGLDIFIHRLVKPREQRDGETRNEYLNNVNEEQDKAAGKKVHTTVKNWIKKHQESGATEEDIQKLYKKLRPKFEYDFYLDKVKEAKTVKDIQDWLDKQEIGWFSRPYAGYFRKVNSVYKYFEDKLEDEMCEVTKYDVEDLLAKAKTVLKEHDEETSQELLPTRSGFFFGSTDYDSWYYSDVKDIIKVFSDILKKWDDEDIVYIYMSW